jgi:hypothetical protein
MHNELRDQRMITINSVATTGVISILFFVLWVEMIKSFVQETLEVNHRAILIAFRRMIENDIKNNVDARIVQGFNQLLELMRMHSELRCYAISGMRTKKAIGESLFLRKLLWASLPNKRQKLRDR